MQDHYSALNLNSGFSLVELLVTVAIVGILAAVSVLSFSEYRGRANDLIAYSVVKNIITAVEAYKADDIELNFDQMQLLINADGTADKYGHDITLPGLTIPRGLRGQIMFTGKLYGTPSYRGQFQINNIGHCDGSEVTVSGSEYGVEYHDKFIRTYFYNSTNSNNAIYKTANNTRSELQAICNSTGYN